MEENPELECREYHSLSNATEICQFVLTTEDCQMDEGFINYIRFALCHTQTKMLPAVYVLYALWLFFLFIALGTTAESFFCPALEFIAYNLKLSQNIAGITVVAFGNGAPDIFSAVAAFTNSNPSSSGVAIGALLGAGVFVTTIVAGSVAITTPFSLSQRPFLRDVVFYVAVVFWTFCLLYKGEIDLANSLGFLALYFAYVIVVLLGRYINQKIRQQHKLNVESGRSGEADETTHLINETTHLINDGSENQRTALSSSNEEDWITQPLRASHEHDKEMKDTIARNYINDCEDIADREDDEVSFSCRGKVWSLINPLAGANWEEMSFIFKVVEILQVPVKFLCKLTVPVVSADPELNDWSRTLACFHCVSAPLFCVFAAKGAFVKVGVLPLWSLSLIVGLSFAILVYITAEELKRPRYYWVFAYVGFAASVLWTYCVANEIVNLLQTFGALINVSNVIMGLTFLAWGNSIGDTVADVTLAKQGYSRMAISACFGGPFFNLIIGVGLPCTIVNLTTGHPIQIEFTMLEAFLVGSLLFSLLFSLVVVPLRRFEMTKAYGIVLIVIYVIYLPVVILTGVHVIH